MFKAFRKKGKELSDAGITMEVLENMANGIEEGVEE